MTPPLAANTLMAGALAEMGLTWRVALPDFALGSATDPEGTPIAELSQPPQIRQASCSTIESAEAAAAKGASDILLTRFDPVPEKLARLVALSQQIALSVVIDHYAGALMLHQALRPIASGRSPAVTIGLVVAVNCGADLRGIRAGHDAWTLLKGLERLQGLRIVGLLADDERPIYLDHLPGPESAPVPPTAVACPTDWTDNAVRARRQLLLQTARRLHVNGPGVERRSVWCRWSELQQPAVMRDLADAGITEVRSMWNEVAEHEVASTLAVVESGGAAAAPRLIEVEAPAVWQRFECTVIGRPQLERAVLALGQVDLAQRLGLNLLTSGPLRLRFSASCDAQMVAIGREWSIVRLGPAARRWRIGDRVAVELGLGVSPHATAAAWC